VVSLKKFQKISKLILFLKKFLMKKNFTDQLNHTISIPTPPKRIISLVPSQTELLFYLGLEKEVVGITKFCIHPEKQFRSKTRIGGTKKFNFEKIKSLEPDLLIGNKEENQKEQIEELMDTYPVWMSDITTFEDALEMIEHLGNITHKEEKAQQLIEQIIIAFEPLRDFSNQKRRPTVAYLIWNNPYMVAADKTFIHTLLQIAGFDNIFENKERYPSISSEELAAAKPDCIFLSSEPYPFKTKHLDELRIICPNSTVQLVDGELFSWYGNRLLLAARYFMELRNNLVH